MAISVKKPPHPGKRVIGILNQWPHLRGWQSAIILRNGVLFTNRFITYWPGLGSFSINETYYRQIFQPPSAQPDVSDNQ